METNQHNPTNQSNQQTPAPNEPPKRQYEMMTTESGKIVAVIILTPEEEALELEQENMCSVAIQMWHLMEEQQPERFKKQRADGTLIPYLIRLDDMMTMNVHQMQQNGMPIPVAVEICLKNMKDEIGLV